MDDKRRQQLKRRLKQCGIKVTQPRLMMLDFLLENRIHPTAECIYSNLKQKFNNISLATVYNNLHCFEECDLVKRINIHQDFDIYDITTRNHPHFICRICGKVFDVKESIKIPDNLEDFQVEDYIITFTGVCKECKEKGLGGDSN